MESDWHSGLISLEKRGSGTGVGRVREKHHHTRGQSWGAFRFDFVISYIKMVFTGTPVTL